MTPRTLCTYLEGTGLPLGAGLFRALRIAGISLTIASGLGLFVVLVRADTSTDLLRALPMVMGLPGFVATWWFTNNHAEKGAAALASLGRSRIQWAASGLFAGLVGLALTAAIVRGPGDASWTILPILALVTALVVGVVPGLWMTLVIAVAALATTWVQEPTMLRQSLVIAGVALTGGLIGGFLHRLLITVLHNLEENRLRFRDQRKALRHREKLLNHALRVGTVGDLAGMVVHQLRNQVQVMMGHVALARNEEGEKQSDRLAQVASSLAQSRPLLDQLMNLAHPDEGLVKVHDLGVQLDSFVAQLRRTLPSALQLDVKHARSGELPCRLEATGLEHALWNLVINARQAMGGSGTLQLAVDGDDREVWIAVTDTGPGIEEQTLAKIFEPYFTTKPTGQGTGLGLTAVARYVRAQGGGIVVRSQVGVGTRFELRFPRTTAEERDGAEGWVKARSSRQAVG